MKDLVTKNRGRAVLPLLLLFLLLAGCRMWEDGNLVVENKSAVAIGVVEFSQPGVSQAVSRVDGLALDGGRYGFWGDPDDGERATVTVYAPDGERVLARGSWRLSFEAGRRYTVTISGETAYDLKLELEQY